MNTYTTTKQRVWQPTGAHMEMKEETQKTRGLIPTTAYNVVYQESNIKLSLPPSFTVEISALPSTQEQYFAHSLFPTLFVY